MDSDKIYESQTFSPFEALDAFYGGGHLPESPLQGIVSFQKWSRFCRRKL